MTLPPMASRQLVLRYPRSADPSVRITKNVGTSPFQPRLCAPTAMAQPSGALSPLPAAGAGLARAGAGRAMPATPSPARQLASARAQERPVEEQRLAQIERQSIRKVLAPPPPPPHHTTPQSHALTIMCHSRCQTASETGGRTFQPQAALCRCSTHLSRSPAASPVQMRRLCSSARRCGSAARARIPSTLGYYNRSSRSRATTQISRAS
jgi:hypothetical protein